MVSKNRKLLFFAFLSCAVASAAVAAPTKPTASVYPGVDWERVSPEKSGWDAKKLAALAQFAFSPESGGSSDALLVVTGGKIVWEQYARGYSANARHYGWSVTKSLSMAMLGKAIEAGVVSLDDPVAKHFPEEAKADIWKKVTLRHLVSMSSGVEWDEGYEGSPFQSNVVAALYRTFLSKDYGAYRLLVSNRLAEPGTLLRYSSGDVNLYQRVLRKVLGAGYADFPFEKIFTPIGMKSLVFERDASGTLIGSSYAHATARDFARFGLLFLRHGKWKIGSQETAILSPEWTALASTASPALPNPKVRDSTHEPYGYGWWLNTDTPQAGLSRPFPALPANAYFAIGHEGQYIMLFPDWDTVVVRLGTDRHGQRLKKIRFGELLRDARQASGDVK